MTNILQATLILLATGAASCSSSSAPANTSVPPGTPTKLSGSLGALGEVKPTVTSLVISNSGETIVYMTSAPITCETLKVSRWLGGITPGAQVIEIVTKGPPKLGTVDVPPNEVNFAEGGRSSASETLADSGSVTYTVAEANGVVEGTVTASYPGGSQLQGNFRATFCAGGQGY